MKLPNEIAKVDPRVQAIRKDKNVGIGSCTTIDECWSHSEILEFLSDNNIKSIKDAVTWAYEQEGLHREMGTNASSGESNCQLIASYEEWQEVMKEHRKNK